MGLTTKEQIHQLVAEKQHILIALPNHPTTDAIASGLAMYSTLQKLGKKVKIISHNFHLPANHAFLPRSEEILSELSMLRKFIITLDVSKKPIEELNYDIEDQELKIYITPKNGMFEPKDVAASTSSYLFDLIFAISVPDLESLGSLYEQNAEFFLETPIVNIDHHPENEKYGSINLIDVNATSTSEIIFELLKDYPSAALDEFISTHLLTGIISNTKSFQTNRVTPKSLAVASYLIDEGARREEIVKNLYQTKSVPMLKLWGRALSNIQLDRTHKLVWSALQPEDFEQSGATEQDLSGVIDELIVNAPEAKTVAIVYARNSHGYKAMINTPAFIDASQIFSQYHPVGRKDFTSITVPASNLNEATERVLTMLKQHLPA